MKTSRGFGVATCAWRLFLWLLVLLLLVICECEHVTNGGSLISDAAACRVGDKRVRSIVKARAGVEEEVVGVGHAARAAIDKAAIDGGDAALEAARVRMDGADNCVEAADGPACGPGVQKVEECAVLEAEWQKGGLDGQELRGFHSLLEEIGGPAAATHHKDARVGTVQVVGNEQLWEC